MSYLGGNTVAGSSAYFAGWGAKKKRRSAVGLLGMAPEVGENAPSILVKREGLSRPPGPSRLVRKLRKLRDKRDRRVSGDWPLPRDGQH